MHQTNANYYNVVLDTGTGILKGFTVMNINDFLKKIKQRLPMVEYIHERLPDSCLDRLLSKAMTVGDSINITSNNTNIGKKTVPNEVKIATV